MSTIYQIDLGPASHYQRSLEGSIEREVEKTWYPHSTADTGPCISMWHWRAAKEDFVLNPWQASSASFGFGGDKDKWIIKATAAKKLIESRLAEALLSHSGYLREYAKLFKGEIT